MKKLGILMMFSVAILASCGTGGTKQNEKQEAKVESKAADGVVTLYSFHTNKRCITCKAIEKLTREVVAEMKNDKIKLEILNLSDSWNDAIAEKYEVTWTSLIADNGTRNDLTKMGFSYAKNQPEVFKAKLKEELTKMLK